MMLLRRAMSVDVSSIQRVFRSAVLAVDQGYYTKQELSDWASCGDDAEKWCQKIEEQLFFVAQNEVDQVVGFVSITPDGSLDLLYVAGEMQGLGIGAKLLNWIEKEAQSIEIKNIRSEVSKAALPLFLQHGYRIEREQKRVARTLALTNFMVYKELYVS